MNIDLKKPIQFVMNDGVWVPTVVSDKGPEKWPLIGVVSTPAFALPMQWAADGTAREGKHWNICNVPEKLKVDVWLNVFKLSDGSTKVELFPTQDAAKCWGYFSEYVSETGAPRIITRSACLHVTTEVEEGHGLTL